MSLTPENHEKGFLVDEEWMGGVSLDPLRPGQFLAFVLSHSTGEYVHFETYFDLQKAIDWVNSIKREWTFERTKDCGGCGEGETCTLTECGKGSCHLENSTNS